MRRNLILIVGGAGLRSVAISLSGVILALHLSQAGIGAAQISLLIFVGLGDCAFATLMGTLWADRFGRRRILLIGLVLYVIAALLVGSSKSFSILLMWRFIHGVAAASVVVAYWLTLCS